MAKATGEKPKGSASRRKRGSDSKGPPAPVDAAANAALAGQAAMAGTKAAGKALSLAAAQAKGPLAAAGGLAAGLAGGFAVVNRRRGRRRAKGFDIAGAAERIGALGEEVGRVAIVIQRAADGSKSSR
jgi:hypothetical protein